ncbi:hypothetical protein J5X84_30990 [Streptosporangiaceae bacterium NEAU-GS5]|nr:hypothetical protein [Streptosporangiaceae bacterium NEAU-GS5]
MNDDDDLGRTLTRVLRTAAAFAPPGVVAVPSRSRRRMARAARLALAAAALAFVVTGVVMAVRMVTPTSYGPADRVEPVRPARPVEQVWPQAVRPLPPQLPWGGSYQLVLVLDRKSVLAETPNGLLQVNTTTGATRKIAPHNASAYGFTTGEGWLAWIDEAKVQGEPAYRVHVVKLDGGHERVLFSLAQTKGGDQIGRMAISGGDLIWSSVKGAGLSRTALPGPKAPLRVPGTAGFYLLAWPWLTDTPSDVATHPSGVAYVLRAGTLRNAVTGEVKSPPARATGCSVSWCLWSQGSRTLAATRDGVTRWSIRGMANTEEIILDRFVWTDGIDLATATPGVFKVTRPQLVDLATGITAAVTTDTGGYQTFVPCTVNGRPYVLDMTAI